MPMNPSQFMYQHPQQHLNNSRHQKQQSFDDSMERESDRFSFKDEQEVLDIENAKYSPEFGRKQPNHRREPVKQIPKTFNKTMEEKSMMRRSHSSINLRNDLWFMKYWSLHLLEVLFSAILISIGVGYHLERWMILIHSPPSHLILLLPRVFIFFGGWLFSVWILPFVLHTMQDNADSHNVQSDDTDNPTEHNSNNGALWDVLSGAVVGEGGDIKPVVVEYHISPALLCI